MSNSSGSHQNPLQSGEFTGPASVVSVSWNHNGVAVRACHRSTQPCYLSDSARMFMFRSAAPCQFHAVLDFATSLIRQPFAPHCFR